MDTETRRHISLLEAMVTTVLNGDGVTPGFKYGEHTLQQGLALRAGITALRRVADLPTTPAVADQNGAHVGSGPKTT